MYVGRITQTMHEKLEREFADVRFLMKKRKHREDI